MSTTNAVGGSAPVEPLAEWEGPAELDAAVFAGPRQLDEFLADPGLIGQAAAWVALTIGSTTPGNSASDATEAKLLGFLTAWRRQYGPGKLDDLKQKVLAAFEQGRADPNAVRREVDELFDRTGS